MFHKIKQDTDGYNVLLIAFDNFESEVLTKEDIESISDYYSEQTWIEDDFMNDDTIPFNFDAFDVIDSGVKYLNPKHFSVEQLLVAINPSLKI